jgi:hypothetical protein
MVRKIGWGLEIAHRLGQFKRMLKAGAGLSGWLSNGQKQSRCLANRWLGILWKLWQSGERYDEAYHLQQIRRHRRR